MRNIVPVASATLPGRLLGALVTAALLMLPGALVAQTYDVGRTYRFTLASGDEMTARVLARDSSGLSVVPISDTDPESW